MALADDSDWELADSFSDAVAALDPAERRFISSGDFLEFMPARQMELALTRRDPADLKMLVGGLMSVADEMGYDPARDMGAMPLNLTSKSFNDPVIMPEPLRDENRSPGPFSVHRYMFPESGVPTFAGAPVAIWPEDLVSGAVDVAIIGIPNDMSSGRRGAEFGPRAMRALDTIATPDILTLLDPMNVLSVVDYGDFSIDNMSTELTIGHVTKMVSEAAATGAIPMLVGGDTSMLYPGVKGVADVQGAGEFGLVHFSAHPDVETAADHTISDEQAVFLLLDESIVDGSDLITVGLRGPAVSPTTLQWLRDSDVRYHTMAEIDQVGYDEVFARVMAELDELPERIFVSIDVSVIEPSQMIAAGRLTSNGLSVKQVTSAIRYLCAAQTIVGFEITDMSPTLDYSRMSVANANAVLNACLTGMAARAAGYGPDEAHPLALSHGQR
jgi:agmatinase